MLFLHISELQMKNAIFACMQMSLFTYPLQPHFQAQIGLPEFSAVAGISECSAKRRGRLKCSQPHTITKRAGARTARFTL